MDAHVRNSYLIQWPVGYRGLRLARRNASKTRRFLQVRIAQGGYRTQMSMTVADALKGPHSELQGTGARYPVGGSNIERYRKDIMRFGQHDVADPSVPAKFQRRSDPMVRPRDHVRAVANNISAIAISLESMPAVEQRRAATVKQTLARFQAIRGLCVRRWRQVLGSAPGQVGGRTEITVKPHGSGASRWRRVLVRCRAFEEPDA